MFEVYWKYNNDKHTVYSVRFDEGKNKTMFLVWWCNAFEWIDSSGFKERK